MTRKTSLIAALLILGGAALAYYIVRVDPASTIESTDNSIVENIPSITPPEKSDEDVKSRPKENDSDANSLGTKNSAFKDIDNATLRRIQPSVKERYFADSNPHHYRRHRVVEIDVQDLRSQLQKELDSLENGDPTKTILIPLFEDRTIEVAVDSAQVGSFGVEVVYTFIDGPSRATDPVTFYFNDMGRMDVAVDARDVNYLIAPAADGPYFIVMELDKVDVFDP